MASPGPEGEVSKRKQNRLTLKAVVAAAGLALSNPPSAVAQVPQAQSSQQQQELDSKNEIQKSLREQIIEALKTTKGWIQTFRAMLGPDDNQNLAEAERLIQQTEARIDDPLYIKGISVIQARGGNLQMFVGSIDPIDIMNVEELTRRLDRIPTAIRGHFLLSPSDLVDPPVHDYSGAEITAAAVQFSQNGILMRGDELKAVVELQKEAPDIVGRLIRISSLSKKLSATEILGRIKDGYLDTKMISNDAFVDGLVTLAEAGVGLSTLAMRSSAVSEEFRIKAKGKIGDPTFVSTLIELQKLRIQPWEVFDLAEEVYRSPFFVRNVAIAVEKRIWLLSAWLSKPVMRAERLHEFLSLANETDASDALRAAEKYPSDTTVWQSAIDFSTRYVNDEQMKQLLYRLDAIRLQDQAYMTRVESYMQDPTKRTQFDGNFARFSIDLLFVQERTGINPRAATISEYHRVLGEVQADPLLTQILSMYEGRVFRGPVLRMNELHDETSAQRLQQLRDIDARSLFAVMTRGGADAFLSTFRLLYNGNGFQGPEAQYSFLSRVRKEHGSLPAFFRAIQPDHKTFGTLLELFSQNDVLDVFLTDIGSVEDQQAILREYLFDASKGVSDAQALTLSDLLHTTKAEPVRDFVFGELRRIQSIARGEKDRSSKIAGLLIAGYFQGKDSIPEWARVSVQEYGRYFPEIRELSGDKVFRRENGVERNVQVHFFYDDRAPGKTESAWDGHASFRNFISSLGGSVVWNKDGVIQRITVNAGFQIKDEGDYVVIRQVDVRTKREVVMYAIKPDRSDNVVSNVGERLLKDSKAPMVTLRGHSYHAGKMIRLLTPGVVMVNLGSCGGAKNISDILEKSPGAQVMATRGVGTMLVNDVIIPALNRTLLREGRVNWQRFSTQMKIETDRRGGLAKERWGSYQMPDKNKIAHLIAALKSLEAK